jgi:toxin-antitoxin system PIN domain toxin
LRALLDVSTLIALTDEDHVRHADVMAWWRLEAGAGWASCTLTQNGLVRILSQPGYANPVPIGVAIDLLRRLVATTDHVFWDQASLLDDALIDTGRILGHRQIKDVTLLGTAVANGGRFVTLDTRITAAAVKPAKSGCLVVL